MRAPVKSKGRRTRTSGISARLGNRVALDVRPDGSIAAHFDGYAAGLGRFSVSTIDRARDLRTGLPLRSFASGEPLDREMELLVRRLARSGLLEYRLGRPRDDGDQVVVEPQGPDYWPRMPELDDSETIVLSRFAYLRRRGAEMVLESPRAGALFRICDPEVAATMARLSTPHQIRRLRRQSGFPGTALLALLLDCQLLFRIDTPDGDGLRTAEGDSDLVLWDFHDLLFHTHSTAGRQANPLGGLYPYAGLIPPPPAVRPRWPGRKVDLRKFPPEASQATSPVTRLLHNRHSIRSFDDQRPITLAELSQFLDTAARIRSKWKSRIDLGDSDPVVTFTERPYPTGGSAYELELYLAVANCEGLSRGFYHYDADMHALVPISGPTPELDAQLAAAEFAMDAPAPPQILITIAARFGRVSWKYSSIAYALVLKDVGTLTQTLYLAATGMGLGGCAIGSIDIDLFAKMTGIEFHVEGPVGQFALGRGDPDREEMIAVSE